MFSGGGLAFAERELKAGAFAITPAPPGTRPDLNGLSCRFDEIRAERGVILSLILVPAEDGDMERFREAVAAVLALADEGAVRPVPAGGPREHWPPSGFSLEAKARLRPGRSPLLNRLSLLLRTFLAYLVFRTGIKVGGFDPRLYKRQLVDNTDFRKFDDG